MELLARKTESSPTGFANHLKAQGPVFWSPAEQIWVVTDYEAANQVLKSSDFSADRSGFFGAQVQMSGCPFSKVANFFGVVKKMMVTSDAPEHTERRKLAQSGISDHVLDHFQPQVKSVVSELLAPLRKGTSVDFVEQVAMPLPNIILADLFSIPAERRSDFYSWANHMTQFFGGGSKDFIKDAENADRGAAELQSYFLQLMGDRRGGLKPDFISHLVRNQGKMDDSEVVSQAAIMLVAGSITTTDQICNNLFTLLESRAWEQIVRDPKLLDAALEEATRLDPAVNFVFRAAKKDVSLAGADIKAGQMVFVTNHSANRSEKIFERPDELILDRTKNPHLSYGAGAHYCLGARLGRIQMKELFTQLREQFPRLSLDANRPSRRKHQSLTFSGFENLYLTLE